MLTVGSREDGRKGLGLGFVMEEKEVEEGEACSGQEEEEEEEEDAFVDPDALSYIDEKLQDVLGHFQKAFEGGVSAENLGAKFGGYGSFLPTYQRSPSIWSQPRSPPRQPSQVGSRSPPSSSLEGARQNPSVPTSASITRNSTASAACKITLNAGESLAQYNTFHKPVNITDQKPLKVRIKVGPEKVPSRNITAIYSGLGLLSPSSSPEESPSGSEGLSPEPQYAPDETPTAIIQIMTFFQVPGGYLLSPLPDNLLHLAKKGRSLLKHCKIGTVSNGTEEFFAVQADLNSPALDAKACSEKKQQSIEKNGKSMDMNKSHCKDDISTILTREIDIETPSGQEIVSDALNIPLLCTAKDDEKGPFGGKSVKISKNSDVGKEPNKILMRERPFPPELMKGNDLELNGSMDSNRCINSVIEPKRSKGKLNAKANILENPLKEGRSGDHKDDLFDLARDVYVEKDYDTVKGEPDEFKLRDDRTSGVLKMKSSQKVALVKQDGEMMTQGKDEKYEGKRKLKGSQNNGTTLSEPKKENVRILSSSDLKEKKKSSHGKRDHPESKSNAWKPRKHMCRGSFEEAAGDVLGDVKVEQVDKRSDLLAHHSNYKLKDAKLENEEPFTSAEKSKEWLGSKKMDNRMNHGSFVSDPLVAPQACNESTAGTAVAPNAPVVIEENWVQCDKCQIWRLLPYETNTSFLPKKWLCSMQSWLPPGMNRCFVSEEETTKALNALYQIPAPIIDPHPNGGRDVAASSITLANGQHPEHNVEHNMLSTPAAAKKKNGLKDASNVPHNSSLTQVSNSVKKTQQVSIKSKSIKDVNQYPSESNSLSNNGLGRSNRTPDLSTDIYKHKQKPKVKNRTHHSDGGDFTGGKYFKSNSKRVADQDGSGSSKKSKTEGLHHSREDWNSDHDMACKAVISADNGVLTKLTGKDSQNYDSSSCRDLKCESSGNLPVSSKKTKGQVKVLSNGKSKEKLSSSDMEKFDKTEYSAKKRKLKEWKESQGEETLMSTQHLVDNSVDVKEALSESEPRKAKKTKVSKAEVKESTTSKADGRSEKRCCVTKIILSGNRERLSGGIEEGDRGLVEKDHQLGQCQGIGASRCLLDGIDPLKKDSGFGQPSTAATSSSSKVSCSRRSRANFQEAKGSPVESVSSSPLRIPSMEKFSTRRDSVGHDDANVGFSVMDSPKRYSDGEVDARNDGSGARRKEQLSPIQQGSIESHRSVEPGVPDSLRVMCDYQDKERNIVSRGRGKDGTGLKTLGDVNDDIFPMELEERNLTNSVVIMSSEQNKYSCEVPEKDLILGQDKLNGFHLANGSSQRKSGKSSSSRSKERDRSSKLDADKGKLKVSEAFIEQEELYSTKNASSSRHEVDTNSYEHNNHRRDLTIESNNCQGKDEKDHLRKKDVMAKGSSECRRDGPLIRRGQRPGDVSDLDMVPNQHADLNLKGAAPEASSGKFAVQETTLELSSLEDKKLTQRHQNRTDPSELISGRGKLQPVLPSTDKHQTQSQMPSSAKGGKSAAFPADTTIGDASKTVTQSGNLDNQERMQSSMRQATPNGPDAPSPIRKDGHSAASVALKEARDLKHKANRFKNEGLELESTSLYFQAALKFLHYASLLEHPNVETARHVEANQSVQIYSETAKLCEFVAHEYEKRRDMAAAALAYKCVEVAYMKVAYFKHFSAGKDRHDLQTALQMALPGESPSSSASDVDNVNNQVMVDKSTSAKGVNSPQIAGSHVIAARSRPTFVRLLNYTNETVCAFEALRKSQNAISLASARLEKDGGGGLSSVKKVLEFNFHNIDRLLHLVRLSMEAISR